MTRPSFGAVRSSLILGVAAIAVAACAGAATPIPNGSGAPAPASAAAPSVDASAAQPSAAAPSAAGSSAEASAGGSAIALPSITLPSDAKDLEALLPATLCGQATTKASITGDKFAATADPQFVATLQALGKTPADVAFAIAFAGGDTNCGAGIFRIKGVDSNALQTTLVAQEQKSGTTFTQGNVGGKNVYISDDKSGGGKQYVYFKGDAVIFAQAPDEAKAAAILQTLP
jgi:hypothetical protein